MPEEKLLIAAHDSLLKTNRDNAMCRKVAEQKVESLKQELAYCKKTIAEESEWLTGTSKYMSEKEKILLDVRNRTLVMDTILVDYVAKEGL